MNRPMVPQTAPDGATVSGARGPRLHVRRHAESGELQTGAAFWSMAAVFGLLVFAVAAPSPLYRVYQADWGFSASTLTAIFGVYALVLLVTLLFFGSISDYLGRRRVIVAGLALHIVACALFLLAHGVGL